MKRFTLRQDQNQRKSADYQVDYDELLNNEQKEAVFHDKGPALVIAGAGTGKTRTLIYRVARLIESGENPGHILLLTFTRRSAREMLDRAAHLLDNRCSQVEGGTFHYYCSQLLHQFADKIGFPNDFTIIDTADAMDVISLLRTGMELDKLDQRFPQKSTLYKMFSTAVNRDRTLHEIVDEQYSRYLTHLERIEELYRQYQQYKRRNRIMDFDDLLIKSIQLLEEHDDVRKTVAARNRHVMVDEYQDTNTLQARLTYLFSSVHKNVMVVGDDAQSIYSFRGADYRNILEFPEMYDRVNLIKLEQNYRSTQNILNLTNRILEQASEKYDKTLYTQKEEGDLPGLVQAPDVKDQSRFLTQMILNLREQGEDLSDSAVLFRNGRDSYDLEVELNKRDIPFVKYGGQKFSEAAHIKDVLAHIRILINPMDTVSWNRVLMLLDGIGPKTARDFFEWIRDAEDPYALYESGQASKSYLQQLHGLSQLLEDLANGDYSVAETVQHINSYYEKFCKKHYEDHPKRLKDLETFSTIAENYRNLDQLIEELTLDPLDATVLETEPYEDEEDPLTLTTIHSAKGLEWKNVFVIQCLDGIIPSGFSLDNEEKIDEELRLLYVACTRARERLFLTYPMAHQSVYGEYLTNPSRFIEEIGESVLEPWILVEEERSSSRSLESSDQEEALKNDL